MPNVDPVIELKNFVPFFFPLLLSSSRGQSSIPGGLSSRASFGVWCFFQRGCGLMEDPLAIVT